MSVYTPAQIEIATGRINYECIKNHILSFSQLDSLIPLIFNAYFLFFLIFLITFIWLQHF